MKDSIILKLGVSPCSHDANISFEGIRSRSLEDVNEGDEESLAESLLLHDGLPVQQLFPELVVDL